MSVRDVIERMNCQFTCGDMGEPPCWQVAKRLDPPVKHVPCEQCIRATNISLSTLDAAGYAVVPVKPTTEMLKPFAVVLCQAQGITDPELPQPPHGEYPLWYERCGYVEKPFAEMLAAAKEAP